MKSHRVLALVAVLAAAPASAEEPAQLLVTATTSHLLPSVRSAQALMRKLSPTTADIKLEAMAGVFLGLDAAMAEAFEGPVDVAVLRGENGDMVGLGAIALAWKDPSKLRGLGAPNAAGVRSVPVDATPLLAQLGAPNAVGAGGACALHPSPVAPGYRLVCAQEDGDLIDFDAEMASRNRPEYFYDRNHPNTKGCALIADLTARAIAPHAIAPDGGAPTTAPVTA